MKYKVMIVLDYGYDEYTEEYSGIEHTTYESAKAEMNEVPIGFNVVDAYIKEV